MYKIIIFGTGLYGKQALQFFTRENVMFWTDNKEDLHGKLIEGIESDSTIRIKEVSK